jgi:hypothetical protein
MSADTAVQNIFQGEIMTNVFFRPWVGENYKTKGFNGKRILVLGESCYCGTCDGCGGLDAFDPKIENPDAEEWEECRNKIPEVVTRFLDYKNGKVPFEGYMRGYSRFTDIFMGQECTPEETQNFWKFFVLYDYVQTALDKARKSPVDWEWKTGEKPFFEVLAEHNPDVIIAWGKRLWDNMPKPSLIDNSFMNRWGVGLRYYNNGKRDIPAYACYHPSSTYFSEEDTDYFKRLLEKMPDASK